MNTIICTGGIGDTYIVALKLIGKGQFKLQRYDKIVSYDKPLKELFTHIPGIEYIIPCKEISQLAEDMKQHQYLQSSSDGKKFCPLAGDDPKGYEMEAYPQLKLKKLKLPGTHIGIQLQTGKKIGNFKGLTFDWIKKLIESLPKHITWHLMGTGISYDAKDVQRFCDKHDIINHVGATSFSEWMQLIMSMDAYITPEGFSAFFALSQKVSTYVFYVHEIDLRRIHPAWKAHAAFEKVTSRVQTLLLLRGRLIQRIHPGKGAEQFIQQAVS